MGARAHDDAATAGAVGIADPRAADDVGTCGEVRALHVLHEVVGARVGLVDQLDDRVDDLGEPLRRDVVAIRPRSRLSRSSMFGKRLGSVSVSPRLVVVRDVVAVSSCVSRSISWRNAREAGLRVPHRGAVVVDRAEVALPSPAGTQRERLRHPTSVSEIAVSPCGW